ncbi:hypothetical protein [Methylicorpusculum sp.]|uniref:hypothetical protein n=1 Tax=Methylicorpusculum sp. TaxID=2713644 RepID=UPI00271A2A01|nr:hypothetical protein [Methylicorpusculum sp.]MDO8842732.1 hypothetical protein [Methylicorpusculum sp.]
MRKSESTEDKAREFIAKNIQLIRIDPESINGNYYSTYPEHCDIFMFNSLITMSMVGSNAYVAVPVNGDPPFVIGNIGD